MKIVRQLRVLHLLKQDTGHLFHTQLQNSEFTAKLFEKNKFSSIYSPGKLLPILSFIFLDVEQTKLSKIEAQMRVVLKRAKFLTEK